MTQGHVQAAAWMNVRLYVCVDRIWTYVKLEAAQAWRRGSVHRQVAVLIVSLAGQEPPFFVDFTSAVAIGSPERRSLVVSCL